MEQIPVISVNLSGLESNPGFKLTLPLVKKVAYGAVFGDILMKCVYACFDGQAALDYLETASYDGVIMDIMIPKKDGMSVLKTIRAEGIQVPVLFLTAKSETQDIVRGLDAGASDYMTKPFEFSELLARLRVMLRTVPEFHL